MPPAWALQKPLPRTTNDLPIFPSSSSSSSKLSLVVLPSKPVFLAGERVTGLLEVGVGTDKIALGDIEIEFEGVEELRSLDYTTTRRLFTTTLHFQGGSLPPSNATVPNAAPLSGTYYPALKGRTRFPFSFPLPPTSASSSTLGNNAVGRYVLRGFATTLSGGVVDHKSENREVRVVERWVDWREGRWGEGGERKGSEKLRMGGEGRLEVEARVGMERDGVKGRLFWRRERGEGLEGNGRIEVKVRVRNGSKKNVSGLKLSLCRRLRIIAPKAGVAPVITSTISSDHFRGVGFEFAAGETREVSIHIELPETDECWTVRKGALFELDVLLRVEVECGFLAKDLAVEIPIWVAHPLSLPPAAHVSHVARQQLLVHAPPSLPSTAPPFPRSRHASMSNISPQAYTYPFQPQQTDQWNEFGALPVPDPAFLDRNGAYSPSFPTSTSMPALNQQYDTRGSPSQYGTKPVSAPPPPPPMDYGQAATPYYVAFDPHAPDLTQSRFLGGMAIPQPHIFAPIPTTPSIPFRPSSAQSFHRATPLYPLNTSPQPTSPSPAFYQPHSGTSSPHTPHSYSPHTSSPLLPSGPPSPSAFLRDSEHAQIHANTAPQDPYSAHTRATLARRDTTPIPAPTPIDPTPIDPPTIPRSFSAGSNRPLRTPPPPSPSSRFVSPGPTTDHGSPFDDPAGLLETIGEDGESQAGTTKSLAPGMTAALANGSVRSVQGLLPEGLEIGVEALEEWVEEEERRREGKTLPPPPVPSEKAKGVTKVPRAQDIFAMEEMEEKIERVSKPAKDDRAATKLKALLPPRDEGGLQALEQRLGRPSTPEIPSRALSSPTTRPLSPPTTADRPLPSPTESNRPLSPPEPRTGALRARSLSRASQEKDRAGLLGEEDPKDAVRRALERAPKESAIGASKRVDVVSKVEAGSRGTLSGAGVARSEGGPTRSFSGPAKTVAVEEPATGIPSSPSSKEPARASSTPTSPSTSNIPPTKLSESYVAGRKVVDFVEFNGLKKEAVSRVSSWLKDGGDESKVPPAPSSKATRRATFDFVRPAPSPPPPSTAVGKLSSLANSVPKASTRAEKKEPTVVELLEAEAKAMEGRKLASDDTLLKGLAKEGLTPPTMEGARYDVRSARGGRGGVVFSVANKWAEIIGEEQGRTKSPPPLTFVPKALKINPHDLPAPPPSKPTDVGRLHLRSIQALMAEPPSPPTPASPKPKPTPVRPSLPISKRWSEPSLAKPFVNTTMGKAPVLSQGPRAVSAGNLAVVQDAGAKERKVGGNKAEGVAKLIARYSQGVASSS